MTFPRAAFLVGGLFGAVAVGLDAAAAHALSSIDPGRLRILQTAVRLSEVHAVLLVALGFALDRRQGGAVARGAPLLAWAAAALIGGLLCFGGGLCAFALTGWRPFAHAAPFGGLSWITAWTLIALSALPENKDADP